MTTDEDILKVLDAYQDDRVKAYVMEYRRQQQRQSSSETSSGPGCRTRPHGSRDGQGHESPRANSNGRLRHARHGGGQARMNPKLIRWQNSQKVVNTLTRNERRHLPNSCQCVLCGCPIPPGSPGRDCAACRQGQPALKQSA